MQLAQVEDKRKNFRLQEALLNGINSVEQGVAGVVLLVMQLKTKHRNLVVD